MHESTHDKSNVDELQREWIQCVIEGVLALILYSIRPHLACWQPDVVAKCCVATAKCIKMTTAINKCM